MRLFKITLSIFALFSITGCATNINYRNANQYAAIANSAANNGDWDNALRYWAKAVVNGDLAKMPASQQAIFNYEYGRALGVQCFWEESEKYLLEALTLDQESNGPTYLALSELSRLKSDQKKYDQASHYFAQAIEVMEKEKASQEAPIAFADFLTEYSAALKELGKEKESEAVSLRAEKLRAENKQRHSITDRTPYGSMCVTN